jgi:hypothetical protein
MRHEHKLFPGVLPYVAIIVFFYFCLRKKIDRVQSQVGFAMVGVLVVIVALTSYHFRFQLYHFVWQFLPGAGGIRAVSRITLVLLFPVVFIFAIAGTALLESRMRIGENRRTVFFGLGLLAVTAIDQAAWPLSVSKRECKRRVAKMEAAMLQARGSRADRNVFWVNQQNADTFYIKNLDIMLAGQALGVDVVNGYSGLLPIGYPIAMAYLEGDCCNDLRVWAGMHPGVVTNDSLIQVGTMCQLADNQPLPLPTRGFSGIEEGKMVHVWAIDRVAELKIPNAVPDQDPQIFSFDLASLNTRSIKISTPHQRELTIRLAPGRVEHVELQIPPHENSLVKFVTDRNGVKLGNGDGRILFFDIENPTIKRVGH